MKLFILLVLFSLFYQSTIAQSGFIIDHRHTNLSEIPESFINSAKENLKIRYFRRSHGSQIDVGGMAALRRYSTNYNNLYAFNKTGANAELFLSTQASNEPWNSLDFENSTWVQITRNYLDDAANQQINVVMWAWSSNFYLCDPTQYLTDMEMLIDEYGPGGSEIISGARTVPVTFVFQTACGQSSNSRNQLVYEGNQEIRQHCIDNDRILYDFNDIECYDPDGNYYGDGTINGTYTSVRKLNDDLAYISDSTDVSVYSGRGNWGIEWMNRNPTAELTALANDLICTECSHSMGTDEGETKDNSRVHCVLKGQAAWWLWAKLAGWGNDDVSVQISSTTQLTETNLNNAVIGVNLTNETFLDDALNANNFQLNNTPSGTSIESITYINNTEASINLAFDGTDFDTDISNFSITILQSEVEGTKNIQSNNLIIDAIDEGNPYASISSSFQLNESNLDNSTISLTLSNETFIDNTLNQDNFQLNGSPPGTMIESITYVNETNANVNLQFDGTDFDIDYNSFSITVLQSEINSSGNLESNHLIINAIDEENPFVTISSTFELSEENLNNGIISLELSNESFNDQYLSSDNFQINNAPSGTSIESILYINQSNATINLAFDGTDFNSNYDNFSITVLNEEIIGTEDLQSNSLTIVPSEEVSATATSSEDLIESNLDNSEITINLTGETFSLSGRNEIEGFILNNAPSGLVINNITQVSNTELTLDLSFTGQNFDSDINNFSITILSEQLSGNLDITTNSLIIKADINTNLIEINLPNKNDVYIYPNPSNGNFKIRTNFDKNQEIILKIVKINGQLAFRKKYFVKKGNQEIGFELQSLSVGIYAVTILSTDLKIENKFIVE